MNVPSKPPERLAEILMEILALSNSARTNRSKSANGRDPGASTDNHGVNENSQRRDEEDNNRQTA
jgi:hypothetical protein